MNDIISCMNCLYALTYEKCGGEPEDSCLCPPEYWAARKRGENPPYAYRFWKEGDGFARRQELELLGEMNIVIGGQGEAEVNVKRSYEETLNELHRVACECGYLIRGDGRTINCILPHGVFDLKYCEGQFFGIWKGERMPSDKRERCYA